MTASGPSAGPSPMRVGGIALLGVGVLTGIIGLLTLALGGDGEGDYQSVAGPSASATSPADPSTGVLPGEGGLIPGDPSAPGGVPPGGSGAVPLPSFGPSPAVPPGGLAAPGSGGTGSGSGGSGDGGSGDGGSGDGGSGDGGSGGSGSGDSALAGSAGPGGGGAGSVPGGPGGGTVGGAGGSGSGAAIVRGPVRVYNNSTISGLAARAAADFRREGWDVEEVGNYPSGVIPTTTVYYRPGTVEQPAAEFMGESYGMRAMPRFDGLDDASPGLIVIVTNDYRGL